MTISATDIVHAVAEMAGPIPATLSDAWQAIIGDRVAVWRLENAAKLQEKVRRNLSGRNLALSPAHIPERYAFAWFEEATKQDEPEIQELFAKLLARAAQGDQDASDRRHVDALSRFTPNDAKAYTFLIEYFRTSGAMPRQVTPSEFGLGTDALMDQIVEAHGEAAWLSIDHLISLGILERRHIVNQDSLRAVLGREGPTDRHALNTSRVFMFARPDLQLDSQIWVTRLGVSLGRGLALFSGPPRRAPGN